VTLEEHSVECVASGERQSLPSVTSSGVVKLMSFAAFNAASVKSKVRTFCEIFKIKHDRGGLNLSLPCKVLYPNHFFLLPYTK